MVNEERFSLNLGKNDSSHRIVQAFHIISLFSCLFSMYLVLECLCGLIKNTNNATVLKRILNIERIL